MGRYLFQRVLLFIPTLLGAVTLVFAFLHLMPGDPTDLMLGETAISADKEALRARLGLDRPLAQQYADYLVHLAHGDLGESYFYRRPVSSMIVSRMAATGRLALASILFSLLLSFPAGLASATHPNRFVRQGASTLSLLGLSVPNFWLGPMLILLFAVGLGWLPVSGDEANGAIILPTLTLGLSMTALTTRMLRSGILEVRSEDYIRAARAKGVGERSLLWKHMLANALIPLITLVGLQAGALLSGAVITETVFGWPGIGRLMIDAIRSRDYPLLQGCVLAVAVLYLVINLIVDLLYAWADPNIRLEASR